MNLLLDYIEDYEATFLEKSPNQIRTSTVNAFIKKHKCVITETSDIIIAKVENSSKSFMLRKTAILAFLEIIYNRVSLLQGRS